MATGFRTRVTSSLRMACQSPLVRRLIPQLVEFKRLTEIRTLGSGSNPVDGICRKLRQVVGNSDGEWHVPNFATSSLSRINYVSSSSLSIKFKNGICLAHSVRVTQTSKS